MTLTLAPPDWQGRWWELEAMRAQFGGPARPLGHMAGPDAQAPEFAFLAVDANGARRSLVLWRERLLAACDIAPGEAEWRGPAAAVTVLERRGVEETIRVHVSAARAQALDSVSLVGVRVEERVILFHAERFSARSPLWFDAEGAPRMRWLATGLAPGTWEIWRELYLDDPDGIVPARAGALYYEGRPGRYYLKKL
jgi:hypothetical protein